MSVFSGKRNKKYAMGTAFGLDMFIYLTANCTEHNIFNPV